jgi:hypothetical protein
MIEVLKDKLLNIPDISSAKLPVDYLKQTRALFVGLCLYILSQAFLVPIVPIGNWSIWPNLSDFAFLILITVFVINLNARRKWISSETNNHVLRILLAVLLGVFLSYFAYLSFIYIIPETNKSIDTGIYRLYRTTQFVLIFLAVSKIPLTPDRLQILRKLVDLVFLITCLGIFLTFTSIIPLSLVTSHLPLTGAWIYFANTSADGGRALGFVGYNHAYVATQILLIIALRLHLTEELPFAKSNNAFLLIGLVRCY